MELMIAGLGPLLYPVSLFLMATSWSSLHLLSVCSVLFPVLVRLIIQLYQY